MLKKVEIFIEIIKKIKYILLPKQIKRIWKLFVMMLISSFFQLLGVSFVLPLLSLMLEKDRLINNDRISSLMILFHFTDIDDVVYLCAIIFIVIFVCKNIILSIISYKMIEYKTELQRELSVRMLKSYMSRPYIFFTMNNTGNMVRGVNADTAGVYKTVFCFLNITSQGITVGMLFAWLVYTMPKMGIGVILLAIASVLVLTLAFKRIMLSNGVRYRHAVGKTNQTLIQTLNGAKEILVMQKSEYFCDKYGNAYKELKSASVKKDFIPSLPNRILETLFIIFIMLYLLGLDSQKGLTSMIPQLASFAMAILKILPSISVISSELTHILSLSPQLDGAYKNFKEVAYYHEQAKKKYEGRIVSNICVRNNNLLVNDISWKYGENTEYILEDVNLEIKEGESVALIGKSGAGKTTLSDIILGLLIPEKGIVTYNNVDIYKKKEWWSKTVGYVPQSVYLFDDTIRFNVHLGDEASNSDDEQIWEALEQAQLKEYVESLPDGLDTFIGERGVRFSGGQRQRIAIARALYRKPSVLVLDEATSALDSETEIAVMDAINRLKGKITLLVVAHRLSTIKNCDTIYEVNEKKVVKRPHEEIFVN